MNLLKCSSSLATSVRTSLSAPKSAKSGLKPNGRVKGKRGVRNTVVYPWQLPDYPGNEVIEITIDERGDIVRKTVLQSLGPDIDSKCLAALDNWHFQPATRNGAPIPSKQDAIFPFKARG